MIYYAHSKKIYNTPREKKELAYLKKKYRNKSTIVCPNKDMGELGNIEPYLKKVRECHTVVCSEYKKHVGRGVFEEISEALNKGKDVFVLRKGLLGFKLKRVNNVVWADINDWKVYYGKVKCQNT